MATFEHTHMRSTWILDDAKQVAVHPSVITTHNKKPYNEKYISIPGYFLQRDIETIVVY